MRARIPSAQTEPGEVQQMQHLRHVALPHQRRIGLVEQVIQQYRLAEIEEGATHGLYGKDYEAQ